jgi:hypothetical protein
MTPYGSEGLYLLTRYAVEVDDPDSPVISEVHVEVIDGKPECVELRCRPRPGGVPVSSEALRSVPLRRYLRESTRLYSERVEFHGDVEFHSSTGSGDELLLIRAAKQQPRHEMTDEFLGEVAAVYSESETKPTAAVVARFHVSRPTASRWVALARERGFLPKLPPKRERKQ